MTTSHLLKTSEELVKTQTQAHLDEREIEMINATPRSNPVGPRKLEIRVDVSYDPAVAHNGNQPGEGEHSFEIHPSTAMELTEPISQLQSVSSEVATEEHSRLPPPLPPKKLPAPPVHGGTRYEAEGQSGLSTTDRSFHEDLQLQLTKERELRGKAEEELRKMQTENKDIRQRWKLAARELSKIQRQGQPSGFYQVTDNYLIDLIIRLRYNIRTICIQYFSQPMGKVRMPQKSTEFFVHLENTTPGSDEFVQYLIEPAWRPKIIQAFLWTVFVEELFNQYRWCGKGAKPMWATSAVLKPRDDSDGDWEACPDPEAEKRYHVWRSTTVGLLLDAQNAELSREADERLQGWKTKIYNSVEAVISGFRRPHSEGYMQEFLNIIDKALELDKEINRQVSDVQWIFEGRGHSSYFDSSIMDLERGEVVSGSKQQKFVAVTSPGVVKRGKSTGEGFNEASMLLRLEVSCGLPRPR